MVIEFFLLNKYENILILRKIDRYFLEYLNFPALFLKVCLQIFLKNKKV